MRLISSHSASHTVVSPVNTRLASPPSTWNPTAGITWFAGRDRGEIGPQLPIEQVCAQNRQGLVGRMNGDWTTAHGANRIGEKRNASDMVEVSMGDEDVVDLLEL